MTDGSATRFTIERVTSPDGYRLAAELRSSVYRQRLGIDPDQWLAEAERDREGYVFVLRDNGLPVAACRAMAIRSLLSETPRLVKIPDDIADAEDVCEIGRLVARGRNRDVPYGALVVCMSSRWLLDNTPFRRFVAYHRSRLLRLYHWIGAEVLDVTFRIPERGDDEYVVVTGDLAKPAALVERMQVPAGRPVRDG